jgi:uncharacterized protein YjbI with pentapeptide repeats
VRVAEGHCVEHVSQEGLCVAVTRWKSGEPLDAREASIDSKCLERLLDALASMEIEPESEELTRLRPGSCGAVHFERASFNGRADFTGLSFPGPIYFDHATFLGPADFSKTTFAQHADFDHVTFEDSACFEQAIFNDHAGFERASFQGSATFDATKFRSYVDLEAASFAHAASMQGATFQLARQIGPFVVARKLKLDESVFSERVMIEVVAEAVTARTTVFADGVRLSVGGAEVDLHQADLGRASTLAGIEKDGAQPALVTLCGAQVAGLSISGFDLCDCQFFGAHGLESLNIESSCEWLHPRSSRCIDREMITEERDWRCREQRRRCARRRACRWLTIHWSDPDPDRQRRAETREVLDPGQLAGLYRALRKAREDSKDQAGAADLYYGEMEMRRRTPIPTKRGRLRACADKFVIYGYWLLAGYGLRASRAVTALAVMILLVAAPLALWGFHQPRAYLRSVLFAAQSSLTLLHPPEAHLSAPGEVIQIVVRLAGPALVGLAILSLRSRIKR